MTTNPINQHTYIFKCVMNEVPGHLSIILLKNKNISIFSATFIFFFNIRVEFLKVLYYFGNLEYQRTS
jgi:hypothetical protein